MASQKKIQWCTEVWQAHEIELGKSYVACQLQIWMGFEASNWNRTLQKYTNSRFSILLMPSFEAYSIFITQIFDLIFRKVNNLKNKLACVHCLCHLSLCTRIHSSNKITILMGFFSLAHRTDTRALIKWRNLACSRYTILMQETLCW